jgi:subtilisin family serine protease
LPGVFGASVDTLGHGTHVAGIAAGNDPSFPGVAPASELVIVKTDFNHTHIVDGVEYVLEVARGLGRPAVVNLSLGSHFDPHDGSDAFSRSIDLRSGAGRLVCCAAGNEGNDNIHAGASLSSGQTKTLHFQVPADRLQQVLINGWYDGAGSLEVRILAPSGLTSPSFAPSGSDAKVDRASLPDLVIQAVHSGLVQTNGSRRFLLKLGGTAQALGLLRGGLYGLELLNTDPANAVRLDLWVLDGQDSPEALFTQSSQTDSLKIGAPAASAEAITVGASTTRNSWIDSSGVSRNSGLVVGEGASFSSEGPLRNGRPKPDLVAPGAFLASAASASAATRPELELQPGFVLRAGTSMACPFVAGLVALLLQRDPTLTPAAVKEQLTRASSIPNAAPGRWDPKWGFGLIDASRL